ncbi:MAG: dienelactone hydrolase family protein [Albidovulum sp.]|nr:dienelactone hydrolase family protein [Albidovulum sp.]MDE0308164.1 dienelactone hydrolase family protein [Albidovulum sp.]MDE0533033.1 dienelactone hydrolase family protein [Albidovulum sp.]
MTKRRNQAGEHSGLFPKPTGIDRELLWSLLGGRPGPVSTLNCRANRRWTHSGIDVAEIDIISGHRRIPAYRLSPRNQSAARPGIVYAHAHGHRYDIGKAEAVSGRPSLLEPPPGIALAQAGFVVVCPDMPGFGARQLSQSEDARAKAACWKGITLLGEMLIDLLAAFETLSMDPLVRNAGIASFGMSMGGTLAYWLAALEPRIAATAHFCVLASIESLIAKGAHHLHAPYMTVPGLLRHGDMGDVAALVAPRSQLVCAGATDPLTPPEALVPAIESARRGYAAAGATDKLEVFIAPNSGHAETNEMRARLVGFLRAATS